jgi:oxygen-independent coproporphyrinogen-3 oxidase
VNHLHARGTRQPLSLYVHIPFCDTVCYYCGCNKIVTKNRDKATTYLGYLKRELAMQGKLFAGSNQVEQLHFGGGTPTYLSDEQMSDLMQYLRRWFSFADDAKGEYSIEVDPRSVTIERIHTLRAQGFNRISLGVQDFDEQVQRAVNRIQPEQITLDTIHAARAAGFRSVSIDLIYGLPKQTLASIAETIAKVIAANPDRIAVYHYAHLPHLFKPQRRIAEADLPSSDTKLDMLAFCIRQLNTAGYVYIGMDHFAKPDDELAVAQRQGLLHRNFQGYSTHAESEMIACGVSAISSVGMCYSQNAKTLEDYYDRLDQGELPIVRGYQLTMDDVLRRFIIQRLMCNFELSIRSLEQAYPIKFDTYFELELEQLGELQKMGLLTIDSEWIEVTLKGRLLIRNICMVFDRHLQQARSLYSEPLRYSRTV